MEEPFRHHPDPVRGHGLRDTVSDRWDGDFILPILAVASGDRALVVVLRSWLDNASGC
jgi:hypothetical protein